MKFGFSSYSFYQRLRTGQMSVLDAMEWVAQHDGDHIEIATVSLASEMGKDDSGFDTNDELHAALLAKSAETGVELSNLVIPADFVQPSAAELEAEIARVKRYVDVAARLGMKLFRHDVAKWAHRVDAIDEYEKLLPTLVSASKEVAQYAAGFGITSSIENHGMMVNASERVRRFIYLVDEPNFKTTLDVGNFLCVDEDPVSAVQQNIGQASIVHLKDFYIRGAAANVGEGWLHTPAGRFIRGSIVGYGDMDMPAVLGEISSSGYDGYVSIEFEGIEDCLLGCERGLANAKRILAGV